MAVGIPPALVLALAVAAGGCVDFGPAAAPPPPPGASPSTPPTPVPAVCGDGVVQGPEECDDQNADNEDGCLSSCYRPAHWVTGDPHAHGHGCFQSRTPDELQYALRDQGIQVASALVWGDGYWDDRPHFTGEDDPASEPGRILHYDLEVSRFPAARPGHLVLLGLRSIDFSESPFVAPDSGIPLVDWARAQGNGVTIGMAHGHFWPADGHFPVPEETCCAPLEFPIHVARGRIHFLETERTGRGPTVDGGTFLLWKSLLNAGFRVALTGASDFPCLHRSLTEYTPKTDVIVDGELTYARWLDGIRAGRTTVLTGYGNHLDLRVNGVRLGGEVRAAAGETVVAWIESRLAEPAVVEIVANGLPVTSLRLGAGTQVQAIPLVASTSFWVVARSPRATTSPIYVVVDGRPIRASADDACYLQRYVDHLIGMARSGQLPLGGSTAMALAAYGEARVELARRFTQAGGQACP